MHPVNFICVDWRKHTDRQESINEQKVLTIVCEDYNVSASDIFGKLRQREIMNARHAYRFILRHLFNYSYHQIARALGNPEHSTQIHSLVRTQNILQTETYEYNKMYDTCCKIDYRFANRLHEIIFKNKA